MSCPLICGSVVLGDVSPDRRRRNHPRPGSKCGRASPRNGWSRPSAGSRSRHRWNPFARARRADWAAEAAARAFACGFCRARCKIRLDCSLPCVRTSGYSYYCSCWVVSSGSSSQGARSRRC